VSIVELGEVSLQTKDEPASFAGQAAEIRIHLPLPRVASNRPSRQRLVAVDVENSAKRQSHFLEPQPRGSGLFAQKFFMKTIQVTFSYFLMYYLSCE
jgi:hypothetical protein